MSGPDLMHDESLATSPGKAPLGATGRPGTDPLLVHVQLRPRWAAVGRATAALDALIAAHPGVEVNVCGVGRDAKYLRVTLSVDLGPTATIARFSAEAIAAYTFVADVFQRLFDHSPCYVAEPTAEERRAATVLREPSGVPSGRRVAARSARR